MKIRMFSYMEPLIGTELKSFNYSERVFFDYWGISTPFEDMGDFIPSEFAKTFPRRVETFRGGRIPHLRIWEMVIRRSLQIKKPEI